MGFIPQSTTVVSVFPVKSSTVILFRLRDETTFSMKCNRGSSNSIFTAVAASGVGVMRFPIRTTPSCRASKS
jgi:hypothetical protein